MQLSAVSRMAKGQAICMSACLSACLIHLQHDHLMLILGHPCRTMLTGMLPDRSALLFALTLVLVFALVLDPRQGAGLAVVQQCRLLADHRWPGGDVPICAAHRQCQVTRVRAHRSTHTVGFYLGFMCTANANTTHTIQSPATKSTNPHGQSFSPCSFARSRNHSLDHPLPLLTSRWPRWGLQHLPCGASWHPQPVRHSRHAALHISTSSST